MKIRQNKILKTSEFLQNFINIGKNIIIYVNTINSNNDKN